MSKTVSPVLLKTVLGFKKVWLEDESMKEWQVTVTAEIHKRLEEDHKLLQFKEEELAKRQAHWEEAKKSSGLGLRELWATEQNQLKPEGCFNV